MQEDKLIIRHSGTFSPLPGALRQHKMKNDMNYNAELRYEIYDMVHIHFYTRSIVLEHYGKQHDIYCERDAKTIATTATVPAAMAVAMFRTLCFQGK